MFVSLDFFEQILFGNFISAFIDSDNWQTMNDKRPPNNKGNGKSSQIAPTRCNFLSSY